MKPQFNEELLDKAVAYVSEVPERFNMEDWYHMLNPKYVGPATLKVLKLRGKKDVPPCGTVVCLAGATNIVAGKCESRESEDNLVYYYAPDTGWFASARDLLGITDAQASARVANLLARAPDS